MKRRYVFAAVAAAAVCMGMQAEKLVLVHTNDTHSQIDPNDKGLGGIARRQVVVDSIRAINPNTLLIDAGDAVQGTLFFTLYGGEVEMKMMNELGYDLAVLGNHDFDNGMKALEKNLSEPRPVDHHQLRSFRQQHRAFFQALRNQGNRWQKSGIHRPQSHSKGDDFGREL